MSSSKEVSIAWFVWARQLRQAIGSSTRDMLKESLLFKWPTFSMSWLTWGSPIKSQNLSISELVSQTSWSTQSLHDDVLSIKSQVSTLGGHELILHEESIRSSIGSTSVWTLLTTILLLYGKESHYKMYNHLKYKRQH